MHAFPPSLDPPMFSPSILTFRASPAAGYQLGLVSGRLPQRSKHTTSGVEIAWEQKGTCRRHHVGAQIFPEPRKFPASCSSSSYDSEPLPAPGGCELVRVVVVFIMVVHEPARGIKTLAATEHRSQKLVSSSIHSGDAKGGGLGRIQNGASRRVSVRFMKTSASACYRFLGGMPLHSAKHLQAGQKFSETMPEAVLVESRLRLRRFRH